jgi:hypothetical protein
MNAETSNLLFQREQAYKVLGVVYDHSVSAITDMGTVIEKLKRHLKLPIEENPMYDAAVKYNEIEKFINGSLLTCLSFKTEIERLNRILEDTVEETHAALLNFATATDKTSNFIFISAQAHNNSALSSFKELYRDDFKIRMTRAKTLYEQTYSVLGESINVSVFEFDQSNVKFTPQQIRSIPLFKFDPRTVTSLATRAVNELIKRAEEELERSRNASSNLRPLPSMFRRSGGSITIKDRTRSQIEILDDLSKKNPKALRKVVEKKEKYEKDKSLHSKRALKRSQVNLNASSIELDEYMNSIAVTENNVDNMGKSPNLNHVDSIEFVRSC